MDFGVLGPLELWTNHGLRTPRGPKIRQILALLVLQANQSVDVDSFIEELWGAHPPRTALSTIRTHLYHLRQILEQESSLAVTKQLLLTQPSGYLLRVPAEQLDLQRFRQLAEQGRSLLQSGRVEAAADALGQALALWRGRCLADVAHGPLISAHVARLTAVQTNVLELRIEADLQLGRHRELIPELRDLTGIHQLNEWFHARLMTALFRSGRRGEALHAFHALRRILNEELGIEPAAELQRLQCDILSDRVEHPRTAVSQPVALPVF